MDSNLETLSRLSLDLLDFLQNNDHECLTLIAESFPEYYSRKEFDVTLRIGHLPDVEEFYCNSDVLTSQSQYFRTALSHNYITKDGDSIIIEEPMVTPNAFRMLLRLLYKNEVDLNTLDGTLFINLIKAAEHFGLNDIRDRLQHQMIECEPTWLQKNFVKIINGVFIDDNDEIIEAIQHQLIHKISANPSYLLNADDLGDLKEASFSMILSDIRFFMNQGIAWDILILWGIRQNQALKQDIPLWSFGDWTLLKDAVKNVISFIKFDRISRNDFYGKIVPFSKVIPQNMNSRALQHYLDKDVRSRYNDIFRRVFLDDSTLINHYHADFILKWIDNRLRNSQTLKKRRTMKRLFTFKKLNTKLLKQKQPFSAPRKFNLIYRITSQQCTENSVKNYKEHCINRPNTLVLAKVQGSNTIIGGFSPNGLDIEFLSLCAPAIDNSFLFCFTNGDPNTDSIVSRMKNVNNVNIRDIDYSSNSCFWVGPKFGIKDLIIDINTMKCICQP
ncbi:12891_t:CDS:2, partial [Cetraspora pellucida]